MSAMSKRRLDCWRCRGEAPPPEAHVGSSWADRWIILLHDHLGHDAAEAYVLGSQSTLKEPPRP